MLADRQLQAHRTVTLVVSDLVGFSADIEPWQQPGPAQLVVDYLNDLVRFAAERGGAVESLAGTRASMIFGAGSMRADEAPVAALEVAREIRWRASRMSRAARTLGISIDCAARVVVATGPCLLCTIRTFQGSTLTAIGLTSATAAALHTRSTTDAIICDESTWAAIQDRLRTWPRGDIRDFVKLAPRHDEALAVPARLQRRPRAAALRQAFHRDGECWTICYDGTRIRMKDSKGLLYLARLLAQPEVEIDSVSLTTDLLAEATGALEEGSSVRVPARRAETGRSGTHRKAAAGSEHARINATRAIRAAIERIAHYHEDLARYLSATIQTGAFCSYKPLPFERSATWDVYLGSDRSGGDGPLEPGAT